jgi:peptidoglycan hydrolase-like protein with peptidoglycan-binding domain
VAPPTPDVPPPTAQEIVSSKRTPTTVATAAPAKDSPSSLPAIPAANGATTTAGRTVLPPIPPAKPSPQAAPTRSSPSSPPLSSSNDIRELQGRLQSLGFDPGTIDGANGPRTAAALTRYQQARGLQPTGIADKDMLAELRQEPGATAPPPPPPPRPRTQSYQYASPPPHQSNPLVDALNRLFGR